MLETPPRWHVTICMKMLRLVHRINRVLRSLNGAQPLGLTQTKMVSNTRNKNMDFPVHVEVSARYLVSDIEYTLDTTQ